MIELSTLDDLPVFVDPESVELIEQQEDGTCICTKSGKIFFVLEAAAEVYFEVKKRLEEKEQLEIQLAALGAAQ